MNLKEVVSDGFCLNEIERKISSFAFISLKTALKSYFSTYKNSSPFIKTILDGDSAVYSKYEKDILYVTDYIEAYAETIIHFQHFFELICKEILRKEHELLVLNINREHEILYKLLKNEEVTSSDIEGINTSEFTTTYERLCKLIAAGKLDSRYQFLAKEENKNALYKLNHLRNRIWHRGTFVLRYEALDIFIGKYILPIITEIVSLPEYNGFDRSWKYKRIIHGIDPISEITNECSKESYNVGKVAFIKEMGRAAYYNPLQTTFKFFNDEIIKRALSTANSEVHSNHYSQGTSIYKCPVCDVNSLVVYEDSEGEMEQDGTYSSYWTYSWYIYCHCCSFKISHELKNPNEYGFDLPDYWYFYEH